LKEYFNNISDLLHGNLHRLPILVAVFFVTGGLDLFGLGLIGQYVATLISTQPVIEFHFEKWIGASALHQYTKSQIFGILLLAVFLVKTVMGSYSYYLMHATVGKIEAKIRADLLFGYQLMPYQQWASRNSSEYINAINVSAMQFCRHVLVPLIRLAADVLVAILILLLFAYVDLRAFAVFVSLICGIGFVYDLFIRRKSMSLGRRFHALSNEVISDVRHAMDGYKEIRILGAEKYFNERIKTNARELCLSHAEIGTLGQLPRYLIEFAIVIFVVITASVVTAVGASPDYLIPVFGIFAAGSVRLVPVASLLSSATTNLRFYRDMIGQLAADYRSFQAIRDCEAPPYGSCMVEKFETLETRGVWFAYEEAKDWALKNVNIRINSGEAVAFVGRSGAGKTTLVDLMLGLLEPGQGTVIVNGRIQDDSFRVLRGKVAYLPQNVFLIDDTLRRNVALGELDGMIDDEKVLEALRRTELGELVEELPNGLDGLIGDRGLRLSGGQRQRVALARAFYFGRDIIVLDEATSAIDQETERVVVDEIMALRGEKTLIVITHRPGVARRCDRVYQLKDGEIVQATPESVSSKH